MGGENARALNSTKYRSTVLTCAAIWLMIHQRLKLWVSSDVSRDNAGLSLKYDHQNLPTVAQRGALRDDFRYGPDGMRTRSWGSDGARVYLPGYEHRTDTGETKVYIGDYAVISRTGSTRKVEYLLKDRLGSVDAVANSSGAVTETRGYDAFGKPRSGTWNDLNPAKIASTAVTPKGFTQHEHLNQLELIHMNGRMYDYNVGRFMGVDPFIQFPLNSQSLNPYSYILNNPLSGTDPSGYASSCGDVSTKEAGSGSCTHTTGSGDKVDVKYNVGKNGDVKVQASSAGFAAIIKDNTQRGMNGGAAPMGVTGVDGRQNQAASAGEKNAAANASTSNAQGGNGSNPADRFLPESMRGIQQGATGVDGLPIPPHTNDEPGGLTELKKKFPELSQRMNKAWENSFGYIFRSEQGMQAIMRPDGGDLRYVEYGAKWENEILRFGYKRLSVSNEDMRTLRHAAGIGDNWIVVVVFHTHPFDMCFSASGCIYSPNKNALKGPSGLDGSQGPIFPNAFHVVREVKGAMYDSDENNYQDYHYGAKAFSH